MEYTTIQFPLIGLEIDPPRSISIGPLNIYLYGIIIACGMVLAAAYALKRRKSFGLQENDLLDGILWIVPLSVICARAYYCIFAWDEFKNDPISVLYIWNGGLAIYGGVIGAAVGMIFHARWKKISLLSLMDLVALGFLIGQCIGRWGNFFNREAFGAQTTVPWRMGLYDGAKFVYYHPTFLYESLWNLAGFIALHFLSKKRQYDGQIALCYVAWYGLGRALIEGLRTDSLYLGSIRISQLLAAVSCLVATGILIWNLFRPHDRKDLFANKREL